MFEMSVKKELVILAVYGSLDETMPPVRVEDVIPFAG